jgi:hypothetical protein
MSRKTFDNKYLHKDFHLSLNIMLNYICENFGKSSVIKYLSQYSKAYYKPLNEQMKSGNIKVLVNYLTEIYQKEEWPVQIHSDDYHIEIKQEACPGIGHIKASGKQPFPDYIETYRTVYEVLCQGTPFQYFLQDFDVETGACTQLFLKNQEESQ